MNMTYTTGSYFNVEIGPPHRLSILRHSSGGWAGNQPFPIQPKVALLDAGGNVVVGDSTSVITAHVSTSLAHNSRVIIDTSNDAIPSIMEVTFGRNILDDERLIFGPGDFKLMLCSLKRLHFLSPWRVELFHK